MTIAHPPKLLKARQLHSRIFAIAVIILVLVSESRLGWGFARSFLMWLGYALVIIGTFGRIYCTAYIGGRKNDTVVREGPFGVVRNPLYVFSFIATAGIGMQSGMIVILLLLLGAFCWYYPKVVGKEEAFLTHKFGDAYVVYKKEVPRWFPKLDLWREPEQVESRPLFIRRSLMDAAVFFMPMPFFFIVSAMHAHRILPVWLVLP